MVYTLTDGTGGVYRLL